ncbi:hypothetical protein BHE74_00026192 [Ensete ventricosum]|nr:hypothetical protein BHE74_00026192 [Ensete ventricosum]RZR77417.1 hypothetical protein BHM03_00002483 [Ensete ventricosum]
MVASSEDAVVIQAAKRAGEPTVITVNCPDQTGLGCDLCRAILDFGLCITRGGPLNAVVIGESVNSCEIELAEGFQQGFSSLPPVVVEELFKQEVSGSEVCSLSPSMKRLKKADVNIDNSLSPSHTLLQIHCVDQKGLLYDIMRTLKDCSIQVYSMFYLS